MKTRVCKTCEVEQDLIEFYMSGVRRKKCYTCYKKQCIEYSKSETGSKVRKEYNKVWSKDNAAKKNASWAKRNASIIKATPKWANLDKIAELYKQAKELEVSTGVKYEVDHIVPLNSELVSGLHCEANLRVIPGTENRIKGNRFWPDCP